MLKVKGILILRQTFRVSRPNIRHNVFHGYRRAHLEQLQLINTAMVNNLPTLRSTDQAVFRVAVWHVRGYPLSESLRLCRRPLLLARTLQRA
jgi:hypothetical protein